MAKNKAAKIQSWGTYVYKNSRYKEISPSNVQLRGYTDEEYAFIPLLSNIKSGILDKMTKSSINGYDCYQIEEDINSNSVLDFGDNEITFIQCDRNQGDKNIGLFTPNIDSTTYAEADTTDILYDPDGYGICFPFLKDYSSSALNYSGFVGAITQWSSGTLFSYNNGEMVKPYDFFPKRYSGNNKKSLSAKYYSDIDAFLIPCSFSMPNVYKEYGKAAIYPDGENCYFGNNISKPNVGSFGICLPQRYTTNYYSEYGFQLKVTDNSAYNGLCKIRYPGPYYDVRQRIIGGITKDNEHYKLVFPTTFLPTHVPYSYAILYDDTNDQFCMLYIYGRRDSNLRIKVGTAVFPFNVLTIEQYSANAVPSSVDLNDHIASLLGDLIDSDNIPVPAPDAYGPGNPYQDTNNAGSSIGGNFDFDDVIETNDATPNTGFDTFDYQTSLFGTYVMSNKNIKDYTHTLNLLYEHSADILFGSAASAMAGRIVEGTTGLLSLPITIPSTNYTNTTFAIGNTGIADESATYAELSNGKFTTANYLTKNMIEYTINIDPIKHRYDNFLDFPPYSSASIYIPYIGTQELPLGLIQSTSQYTNTLQLKVRVDVPTGDFVVILFSNGVPITHWNGNCARTIQLAVNDNSQIIRSITNQISKAAGAIGIGVMTGGVIGAASQLVQTVAEEGIQSQTPISTTQHKIGNIQNSGISGWMDNQQFYIIVERPVMYLPYNYGHHIGYPTDKVVKIGSCEGFCQFGEIHLECSANQAEKDEITRVLQKGVILNVS